MNGDQYPTFLNSLFQPPASIFWNSDSSQRSRAARKSPDNAADCRSTESPNDRTGECERPENRRSKNGQACECAKRTTDKTAFLGVAVRLLPADGSNPGDVTVSLEHHDPALSVPLYAAPDYDDVVAEWQMWARALGLHRLVGELARDAWADLIAIPFTGNVAQVYEAAIHHQGDVLASVIDGQWAIAPGEK